MLEDVSRAFDDSDEPAIVTRRAHYGALDVPRSTVDSSVMGRPSNVIRPMHIFVVATVLGVLTGLQAYNYVALTDAMRQPLPLLLVLNLSYWYSWALVAPGILWMARRFRFERKTWPRAVAVHLLGVLVFTAAHVTLFTTARVVIRTQLGAIPTDWWALFQERYFGNFDWEMMTYWALIALSNALDYHRESQERELTAAQLQTQLAEAQLEALQRQLHPHFLFNTLNTIGSLTRINPEEAREVLVKLSQILRRLLQKNENFVPLREELEFIENYMSIEMVRFGPEKLLFHKDVDEATLDAIVPSMLLQPIVENSIRHGLSPRLEGGEIRLRTRRLEGRLVIELEDNGVGMEEERIADVYQSGIGISNVNERLKVLYGKDYKMKIESEKGRGTSIRIEIPEVQSP